MQGNVYIHILYYIFIFIIHHVYIYLYILYLYYICYICYVKFRCDIHPQYISTNGLQQNPSRSRSVPEGLANTAQNCECIWNYRNRWQSCSFRQPSTSTATLSTTTTKPIQVVEQITTSV